MPDVFANKYPNDPSTVTTGALTPTDTSIPVPSTAGYSAIGQFRVLLDESVTPEYALVTVGDATHLTTVGGTAGRGIEGTTAASHLSGATVVAVLTAGGLGTIGGSTTQRVVVDLTAAQISTLLSDPVVVLAAPGAGKVFWPKLFFFEYTFGTTPYNGVQLLLAYQVAGNPQTGFEYTINDVYSSFYFNVGTSPYIARTDCENKAVVAILGGDPGAGDGTIRITLDYEIVTLA